MNDAERLDAAIREQAEGYHRPPETPREAVWARIQAEREARRLAPVPARPGRVQWLAWAAGIAALLAVGIALGRLTAPRTPVEMAAAPESSVADPLVPTGPDAYQVAATDHLSRVETFLTVFRGEVDAGRVGEAEMEMPARQLLRRTRLLRASPAARDDVILRALLDDIEFVLLQIASYAQVGDERELRFVEQGLNQRSVLLRLRTAMPSPPARTASGGAL
jgi:hypothetical protein